MRRKPEAAIMPLQVGLRDGSDYPNSLFAPKTNQGLTKEIMETFARLTLMMVFALAFDGAVAADVTRGEVTEAKLRSYVLSKVMPEFPEGMLSSGDCRVAVAEIEIDLEGNFWGYTVLEAPSLLAEISVARAISQWTFKAVRNDELGGRQDFHATGLVTFYFVGSDGKVPGRVLDPSDAPADGRCS